jgi:hypothetical protein
MLRTGFRLQSILQDAKDRPTLVPESTPQGTALNVAVTALAILSAQTALASVALRTICETVGDVLDHGVRIGGDGRYHAFVDRLDVGAFGTFDSAVTALRERLSA